MAKKLSGPISARSGRGEKIGKGVPAKSTYRAIRRNGGRGARQVVSSGGGKQGGPE